MNHHAILYCGNKDQIIERVQQTIDRNESELVTLTYEVLGINDVRALINLAYQKPDNFYKFRTIFIIAHSLATEAQQALLKILEEPPSTTRFIFCLPDVSGLLVTVRSRFLIEFVNNDVKLVDDSFNIFMKLPIPARLSMIADISKSKDDALYFKWEAGLIEYLEKERDTIPTNCLVTISDTLRFLRLRGSSKKMLWEEMALILPVA